MALYDSQHEYDRDCSLSREEVVSVVKGHALSDRMPMQIHFWINPDRFADKEQEVREIMGRYPCDMQIVPFSLPEIYESPEGYPEYRWAASDPFQKQQKLQGDDNPAISDWGRLDEILERFPDPRYPDLFDSCSPPDGRYRLGHWWFCLFERHWTLRGMSNALMDFYTNPSDVHRLFRALTNFYKQIIRRGGEEQKFDGVFTSDDLGTQKGPFFSMEIFNEFFKPYYGELFECAHECGMDFWLHACGDVEPFIPGWIEAGLDVLHPIQKYAMDDNMIALRHGGKISFWAGLEVQQKLPRGTPEDVRKEVRCVMNNYWRHGEGRCIFTVGNGINEDCPLDNLRALFDESLKYGKSIARRGVST